MGSNSPQYQAMYRADNPEYMARQRKRAAARTEATKRLRELHHEEFEALLHGELKKRNVL